MKRVDTEGLKQMRQNNQGFTLINVLGEGSYLERHIPGSKSVPVDRENFTDQVEHLVGGLDKPVVVYCASKECDASPKAADKLEKAGFSQVYDYEGGIRAWKQAGFKLAGSEGSA